MLRILREKQANRHMRSIWSYIGLFVVYFYYSNLKIECQKPNKECKKEDFPSIYSMDLCVDCINAFYAVLYGISNINEECSISRIGSIMSEHFLPNLDP